MPRIVLCPACHEVVPEDADTCAHCGGPLCPARRAPVHPIAGPRIWNWRIAGLLSLICPGAGQLYKGQLKAGLFWLLAVTLLYLLVFPLGVFLHLVCALNAAFKPAPVRQFP